ncbi:hypothetical protein TRIATDRAFT_300687, partial [Trichoderma atroviride IMI 206040]
MMMDVMYSIRPWLLIAVLMPPFATFSQLGEMRCELVYILVGRLPAMMMMQISTLQGFSIDPFSMRSGGLRPRLCA